MWYNYSTMLDLSDLESTINDLVSKGGLKSSEYSNYFNTNSKIFKCKVNVDNVVYTMPVPGLTKEDINIKVEKEVLIVTITKQSDFIKDLTRKITLVEDLNKKSTKAEVKDGLLTITFLKSTDHIVEIGIE